MPVWPLIAVALLLVTPLAAASGEPAPTLRARVLALAGKSEPVPATGEAEKGEGEEDASEAGRTRVFYRDHATHLEMEGAHIQLSHRIQFRFIHTDPPDDLRLPGTTGPGQGKGSFRIRRAKTTFEGWFWKPELTFELQLNWAEPEPGASTETPLEDGYIQWDASKKGAFQVRIGQFKVPLGRQEMSTSSGLQFVERSFLSFEFTRGRDIGLMVSGRVADDKLEYHAGMFNGNPASRLENDNTKFQYNGRLSFQPFGPVRYRESDFETTDKPLLAIDAELESNDLHGATNANDLNTTTLGAALMFKYKGFSLFGEYFDRNREPEEGASYESNGFILQSGLFLVRNRLEVAFRWAGWDPTDQIPGNDQRELGGALNYFIVGHALKLQADYREIRNEALDRRTREVRLQTQVIF
jgi:phosphate-selective porin OprO/OprP